MDSLRRATRISRRAAIVSGALSAALFLSAHVGSPDAFFEGKAGAYPIHVIIRSPDVIPARAEIIVRVTGAGVTGVSATARAWGSDSTGAPPADAAERVPGDSTLWSLQLWMMRQGSYAVLVHVDGSAGSGTAVIPYTAVAQRVLGMNHAMGIALTIAAIFLVAGMLTIVKAAAGEATIAPGAAPGQEIEQHARRVRLGAGVLFVVIIVFGRYWWNLEDAAYSRAVFRSTASIVTVRDDSAALGAHRVRAGGSPVRAQILRFAIDTKTEPQRQWVPLISDHGKLVHLFLVKKDNLGAMAHLHPVAIDPMTYESALPPMPAGAYFVFADVVHENGFAETLTQSVTLGAAPAREWKPGDADDATFMGSGVGSPWRFDDGSTLSWDGASGAHVAGADARLRFTLRDASGAVMRVEPYMGMAAHAVIVRDDGAVFVHVHPMGTTPSMGAMQSMGEALSGQFEFPWAFPKAGHYRIWVQFRIHGAVRTAAFDVTVGS